ncbi:MULTISPECIES: alpha/beta hydrolase [unclassified Legionella]|uniref:alpha/beta hydrolase n=1 Tax=unclassified Legionella TaxID=2622702 RepID=UPI001E3EF72E|nr:alpha/beta fold hydrolase [Legionella sp. 31fI33]MCC5014587.1 alpha/beta fold hydrolase [Legionella sp. 31fI33]
MNIDAFRCMRRGVQLFSLTQDDFSLMAPIEQRNGKKQRALLLLHGFSSSPAVFRDLLPSLAYYDAVICPVLPGHAANLDSFAQSKASDWFVLAEQTCELLVNEFTQVDVMGLSLGGLLACHLSNRFPLHHLYLLAPALDLRLKINRTLGLAKLLNYLGFSQVRSVAGNLYTDEHCEISYRKIPLAVIIEVLTSIRQFQFSPPNCPTDLFLGCHDKVVASWQVAARFANMENVTIHWLANSAHIIPLDGDTDSVLTCIKQNNMANS